MTRSHEPTHEETMNLDDRASQEPADDPTPGREPGRDAEPTAAEILQWRRDSVFMPEADAVPDEYPALRNMSAAFMYSAVIRPLEPTQPEFVTLPVGPGGSDSLEARLAISEWNLLWEAGQFRRRFFDLDDLPESMAKVADLGDVNVTFVPRSRSRYFEYAPLVHLLPRKTLEGFGLPVLRPGQWPFMADHSGIDDFLPDDFEARLSRAWAWTVWCHLESGSKMRAFTREDPIRLLAHNLDFWVPAVTATIQNRLREFPEVDKGKLAHELGVPVTLEDGSVLPGAVTGHPRMGGQVWFGENDARDAVAETVQAADATGRLRGILDAVRSNRVADDFSDHWSFAREDFERKLHGKRRKVKVRFVEVPDTIPVQGPRAT